MHDNTACCGVNDHAAVCWGHGFCCGWHGTDLALVNAGHLGPGSGPLGTGSLLFIFFLHCVGFSHINPHVCVTWIKVRYLQGSVILQYCQCSITRSHFFLGVCVGGVVECVCLCGCWIFATILRQTLPHHVWRQGMCAYQDITTLRLFVDMLCFLYLMLSLLLAFIGANAARTWSEYCGA